MALTALPLTDSFPLAWEWDPALDRERPNFDDEYRICVETLDWDRLCIPGQKPTLFHFRPMRDGVQRALLDMGVGTLSGFALAFRLCLVRVENLDGAPPVERKRDPEHPKLGDMATTKIVDYLFPIPLAVNQQTGSIVTGLGAIVLSRCMGLSPKS